MGNHNREITSVEHAGLAASERALTDDDQFLFTIGHHSDLSLLILGESGVGKSHLARLVHDGSPRTKGPFVVADCGTMTEALFESERSAVWTRRFAQSGGDDDCAPVLYPVLRRLNVARMVDTPRVHRPHGPAFTGAASTAFGSSERA